VLPEIAEDSHVASASASWTCGGVLRLLRSDTLSCMHIFRPRVGGRRGGVIVVHQVYNNHTTLLHKGWAPYIVGPTPCEGVLYDCCTLGVQLSLFGRRVL
jgi:hypothetical protein